MCRPAGFADRLPLPNGYGMSAGSPREAPAPLPPLNPPLDGLPPANAPLLTLTAGLPGAVLLVIPCVSCGVLCVPPNGLPDAPPLEADTPPASTPDRPPGRPKTTASGITLLPPGTGTPCPAIFPTGILPPVTPAGLPPGLLPPVLPVPALLFGLLPPEPVPLVPVPPARLLCELLVLVRLALPAVRMERLSLWS